MNKIKRSLAYALALMMLIGLLPMNVSAAAKIAFQKKIGNVYENGNNKGAYTYTLKNVSKGQTVKWSVSGAGKQFVSLQYSEKEITGKTTSNVITIKTNGNDAAKNAKFKLTAKVYSSKRKLVATVSTTSKIKVLSKAVTIVGKNLEDEILPTGTECLFGTEITPANSTDTVVWKVKDSEGVDQSHFISEDGTFSADELGTYTVTATTYNGNKERKSASYKIVVEDAIIDVEQTEINEFCIKFSSDIGDRFSLDKIRITGDDKSTMLAKAYDVNPDGTICVTTHTNFSDQVVYTVKYGSFSKNFEASVGEPKTLQILTTQVTVNKPTAIQYVLLDRNGFDVTSLYPGTIKYTPLLTNGIIDDNDRILMKTVGASGTIHAVFTPKDENLEPVEGEGTVVCAVVSVADKHNFTVTASKDEPDYTADSYQDQRNIYLGAAGLFVHFRALDAEGDAMKCDSITYTSLDPDALIIQSSGQVIPIKAKTVPVLVVVKIDGVEYSYNYDITITEAPGLNSIELDRATVQVSNLANLENRKYIKVTAFDQSQLAYELKNENASFTKPVQAYAPVVSYDADLNRVVINPSSSLAGTYEYQLTISSGGKSVSTGFTVIVSNVPMSGTVSYEIELDENVVDVALNRSTTTIDQYVSLKVAKYINDILAGYQTFSVTGITKDGKYYGNSLTTGGSSSLQTISNTSKLTLITRRMTEFNSSTCSCEKAAVGVYLINISYYRQDSLSYVKDTVALTVKDSTEAVVPNVDRLTSTETCKTALELAKNCISVKNGEITDCTVVGEDKTGDQIAVTSKDSYHIKDITVITEIEIANGMKAKEIHKVAVGRTFTNR